MTRSNDLGARHPSGFATLQRVLDIRLQVARGALATRRQEAVAVADQVLQMRQTELATLGEASHAPGHLLDVPGHHRVLLHLVGLAHARHRREMECHAADGKVSEAVTECLERDRRLAVAQRLQDKEQQAQAALAARRLAREADLEWLARTQGKTRK